MSKPEPTTPAGTWTRTSADGDQAPIPALSPDSIERLERNPAWVELCALAQKEIQEKTDRVLSAGTTDEEANKIRRGIIIAKEVTPMALLKVLKVRHPKA